MATAGEVALRLAAQRGAAALRAALRRWRAFGAFGSTDAASAAAPGTAAAASPSATAGEGDCGWEKESVCILPFLYNYRHEHAT